MSELGEIFKELKEKSKAKKQANYDSSLAYLKRLGVSFQVCNERTCHILVMDIIDFFPTTGFWKVRKTNFQGRGLKKLVSYLSDNLEVQNEN